MRRRRRPEPFTFGILYRRASSTAISALRRRGRGPINPLRGAARRPTRAPSFRGKIERTPWHRFNAQEIHHA
jgi:hypothetical protein